jgi:hypothetical protein
MIRATPHVRARSWGSALVAVLVVALLVPTAFLFLHSWNEDGDRKDATQLELDGVTYLRALNQLTLALSNAQSLTVGGRPVNSEEVATAIEQVGSVDDRLGTELGTHDRWAGLRGRLEALAADQSGNPTVAIANFSAAGELLLGLYAKVRDRSGLGHDSDAAAFHLQDAAAADLPSVVIAGSRLAALAAVAAAMRAPGAPAVQPPPGVTPQMVEQRGLISLGEAQARLDSASDGLVEGLRAAVDSTESRTLGGNLLGQLDAFQLAAEGVASLSGLNGGTPPADASINPVAVNQLRAAAADLSATVLSEVDTILEARLREIDDERLMLLGAAIAAGLLAAAAVALLIVGARRGRGTPLGPEPSLAGSAYAAGQPHAADDRRWRPDPVVSPYDDVETISRWERSGAAR